jgi:UTP:GlnB (protein PII) uridylyltransferase
MTMAGTLSSVAKSRTFTHTCTPTTTIESQFRPACNHANAQAVNDVLSYGRDEMERSSDIMIVVLHSWTLKKEHL